MLKKLLGFDSTTMTLRTESIAGITTFLTMSYILAVNTSILSSTGMDKGAVFTATALATALSTLLLAFMAKLPLAQAPSMGINAFFAFTLVQGMGYPWQVAMAALFVEGLIFILITFFNVREIVLNSIPATLRYAISVGIGMFIAFIGLKNAGIIVSDPATFVTFGPFTPVSVLALTGILLSGLLVVKQVKGALFYSILICTLIGIPLGVTTIPEGFLPISTPHSLAPTFCQFDFSQLFTLDMAVIIFTLLFMDMFDTIGTLVALTYRIGIVKENGEIPRAKETMLADAIGSTFGAILGCSTITTYLESASGVAEGGRSGFTSLVTGGMFLLAIFFAPIFLLIPGAATTGALVLVGVFMMESITQIDMKNIAEALPAFITIITMVLTYSVANGIILGMLCYVLLKLGTGRHREVSPTMYVLSVLFLLKFIFTQTPIIIMYMEKKFFMIVLAAMMAMAAFTACGDDDASRTMSGGEMLKNISMVIADQADAEKLYQAEEDAPNMILVADSKEAAHKLCERLIADTWDGKPRTVKLPDDCGIISLAPAADESIFCTVSFTGLKSCDHPVFSLTIAPKEYLDGDNPSHYHEQREPLCVWRCGDCSWWTNAGVPIGNKCGRCGSKNIIEPKRQR